jgi:type I restriction enzyme, S subunit
MNVEITELQEVAEVVQGGRHQLSGNHFVSHGYPAYGAGGINGFLETYEFEEDAIVLSAIGARCGKCFFAKGRWTSLANTQIIRPDPKQANARFLWFQLNDENRWPRFGTGQPFIKPSDVKAHRILLPTLREQDHVANLLERADRLRSMRRHAQQMCDELLSTAFLALFGDPVANPHGFPVVDLGDFLSFVTSGSRGWAEYYAAEGARFIRSLDVRMNSISDDDAVFVNPPKSAEANRTRVKAGDVLLTITGSRIGRVAPAPDRLNGAFISQHVAILRLKPGLLPKFLSMFLSLDTGGQREIARVQYGQTKPGLNLQQIREFQMPLPPLSFQKKIIEIIGRNQHLRANYVEALRQADHLFHTLLHTAFSS